MASPSMEEIIQKQRCDKGKDQKAVQQKGSRKNPVATIGKDSFSQSANHPKNKNVWISIKEPAPQQPVS